LDVKYKSLIKNIGYLTISNFASKILVFLLVPLYTNVLSTEEYGSYDAIATTVSLLAPFVIANISDGVMRFLLDKKQDKNEIMSIGLKYTSIGIIIMALLALSNRVFHYAGFLNGYEFLAFLYAAFYILNSHFAQCAKGLNQVSVMAKAGVVSTATMILFNVLFLLVFHLGITGFFLAHILGLAIPTLYYCAKIEPWKYSPFSRIDKQTKKLILAYSIPLIFNTIGWTINSSLDKYCVIYFYGVAASGILAVSYKIPTILSVIYSMFTQAWQISAVTEYDNNDREKFYSDTYLFVNALGCLCCGGLILINKPLSRFLFAKDFYQAWQYVPFLLVSVLFNQTAGFVGPLLSAKKESNAMAKAAVAGSIVNLVFNIVLIKIMGVQGAAIATAISSFVIYLVRWWYARELLERRIYSKLYLSWIITIVSAVAEILSVQYFVQALALLIIIIVNLSEYKRIIHYLPIRRTRI